MKKRIIIGSTLIATVLALFVVGWVILDDDNNSPNAGSTVSEQSSKDNPKETDTPEPTSQEKSEDEEEPANVEDETVAIEEVEFQPIEEDEDPNEIPFLPVTTNHYTINQLNDSFYEIELYAILNKPEQYNEYTNQLKIYKQEALNYLIDNDVAVETARISYIPTEAAQL